MKKKQNKVKPTDQKESTVLSAVDAVVMRNPRARSIIKTNKEFDDWMVERPDSVKSLAKEFPFGVVWKIDNEDLVIIGWNESDTVLFSKLYLDNDHRPDIDKMFGEDERIYICADHLRT